MNSYEPPPSIIYACLAHRKTILVDYAEVLIPKLDEVIEHILEKVLNSNNTLVVRQEKLVFNVLIKKGIVSLCVTGKSFPTERAFEFLEDIHSTFRKMFDIQQIKEYPERSMNKTFSPLLKQRIISANNLSGDPINRIKDTLDHSMLLLNNGIERLTARGDNLDELQKESDLLMQDTFDMQTSTKDLKDTFKNTSHKKYC
ncbi:Longin-type vesicle-associated membrane protein [Entamoeba marina]